MRNNRIYKFRLGRRTTSSMRFILELFLHLLEKKYEITYINRHDTYSKSGAVMPRLLINVRYKNLLYVSIYDSCVAYEGTLYTDLDKLFVHYDSSNVTNYPVL